MHTVFSLVHKAAIRAAGLKKPVKCGLNSRTDGSVARAHYKIEHN